MVQLPPPLALVTLEGAASILLARQPWPGNFGRGEHVKRTEAHINFLYRTPSTSRDSRGRFEQYFGVCLRQLALHLVVKGGTTAAPLLVQLIAGVGSVSPSSDCSLGASS